VDGVPVLIREEEGWVQPNELNAVIDQLRPRILWYLERLVNIQSGTKNPDGVSRVIDICQASLDAMGFTSTRVRKKNFGSHLIAVSPPAPGAKILVVGHADTVFPPEGPHFLFKQRGDRCFGPGVMDMKGGLVCLIYGLEALLKTNGTFPNRVTVIINSDEEIGSPSSRPYIEAEARRSDFVLIMEPALTRWTLVTARSGAARFALTVRGRAAHVCRLNEGASAIRELAHKILALERITDLKKGISVCIGTIEGGVARNVVPPFASASIDLRFRNKREGDKAIQRIEELAHASFTPGTHTKIEGGIGRPPMMATPASQHLFAILKKLVAPNGWRLRQGHNSGVSDGNFTANLGVATVDGLGPYGNYGHSERECIFTESLFERCKLIGLILGADFSEFLATVKR
jgi:glutamate carboxypeptidase